MLIVDRTQLESAANHMAAFGRVVDECLEGVEQTMAVLRSSWHGDGSDAQAQAQQQWKDGAEQMKTALSALQQNLEAAHKNYSEAVDKNGRMWQV
ncbi:WXG100 family type VII secretion target [Mycobacterium sp. DL440]|uniref:WXG100 family type VII secretion target n=1 Tax=Mycobacterium sp. DL440 TaxID=2675523 RepID=UPI001FB8A497|nr:WXG100 family type VII secretion target [Mycobacterium sp. DL440]